jgi:hypothetical protein
VSTKKTSRKQRKAPKGFYAAHSTGDKKLGAEEGTPWEASLDFSNNNVKNDVSCKQVKRQGEITDFDFFPVSLGNLKPPILEEVLGMLGSHSTQIWWSSTVCVHINAVHDSCAQ